MTEYTYHTYSIGYRLAYDPSTQEIEIDALTPAQQREIARRINEALDRSMSDVLCGGYYVPALHEGKKGTTYEHVRGPRALLPDSRQGPCESSPGAHQPRAGSGETENPSEG
jgi:hypothetical protein